MTDRTEHHENYGASGTCPTGKVRYANEKAAAAALARVQRIRASNPDEHPPERQFYECEHCASGWHLSSRVPELEPPEDPRREMETVEEYAARLERRIKHQRDSLEEMNALRTDAGNRAERKRIQKLTMALGKMTLRWQTEREAKLGLVKRQRELEETISSLEGRLSVLQAAQLSGRTLNACCLIELPDSANEMEWAAARQCQNECGRVCELRHTYALKVASNIVRNVVSQQ